MNDYGFNLIAAGYSGALWAYAKSLNAMYDFDSLSPGVATKQILAALSGNRLTSVRLPNSAYTAPVTQAQAKVKAAYLLATASRLLGSEGLARLARQVLSGARTGGGNKDITAITATYAGAGAAIRGVAGARVGSTDITRILYVLGTAQGRNGPRNLSQNIQKTQARQWDPKAETKLAEQKTRDRIQNILDTPGRILRGGKRKYRSAAHRRHMEKLQRRRIWYTVGALAGTFAALALLSSFSRPSPGKQSPPNA